jgi:CYTH domain-containing protein
MIERERKFKLKEVPPGLHGQLIEQGYLMFDGNKHLRVRIINGKKAYLTFKTIISQTERIEYEYEIPVEDGVEMLNSTNIKLEKIRYKTEWNGNNVDIDIFKNGLRVVEIEYDGELTSIPDYCGEDVTFNREYSNLLIAMQYEKQ